MLTDDDMYRDGTARFRVPVPYELAQPFITTPPGPHTPLDLHIGDTLIGTVTISEGGAYFHEGRTVFAVTCDLNPVQRAAPRRVVPPLWQRIEEYATRIEADGGRPLDDHEIARDLRLILAGEQP